jgi:hypothetical protein
VLLTVVSTLASLSPLRTAASIRLLSAPFIPNPLRTIRSIRHCPCDRSQVLNSKRISNYLIYKTLFHYKIFSSCKSSFIFDFLRR